MINKNNKLLEKDIKLENGEILNTIFNIEKIKNLPSFSHTSTAGMLMSNAVILHGSKEKGIKFYEVYLSSDNKRINKICSIGDFYKRQTIWKRNWYN